MRKEMGFYQKCLEKADLIAKMTGLTIIRPASFDPKLRCTLHIEKSNYKGLIPKKKEQKIDQKVKYM